MINRGAVLNIFAEKMQYCANPKERAFVGNIMEEIRELPDVQEKTDKLGEFIKWLDRYVCGLTEKYPEKIDYSLGARHALLIILGVARKIESKK